MKNTTRQGRTSGLQVPYDPAQPGRPNPLMTFSSIWFEGRYYYPRFGDRNSLLLLRYNMPKKVSFSRAYSGWRAGGSREERELGEGRAFFRWLQRHQISIQWKKTDFELNPYFSQENSPRHDPGDEMAQGLSFAIRPVRVSGRHVKLYVQDDDMLALLNLGYGEEEDFLELVMKYVTHRFQWEQWRAPAPHFLDWVKSQGKRPVFGPCQLGLELLRHL